MRPRVEERIRVLLILLVFQTRRRRKGGTIWKEFFSRARYDAKQHRKLMKIPGIFTPASFLNAVKKGSARLPYACGSGIGHRFDQETRLSAPVPRS
ncbi:hypothetical protein Metfor_1896 [Methanoregula formicica SMSP]|uniref:Uncharacterized protein n=1 Tax=Methanoregula formicica (strain DSM 22288 / NBRC 105244 / SMSP) TaxID=593750 RepID=L0HDV4_METFS|nr:hypothetical protein Metfor_1896 [Methanoregula formicica SMSP]